MIPRRFNSALAQLAVLVVLAAAAPPTPGADTEAVPDGTGAPGQLLVASPELDDSPFDHTVVLLLRHDKNGAMGVVLNRPVEEKPLASVMKAIGADPKGVEGRVQLYSGGPVQLEIGLVIHSPEYHRPQTMDIDGRVAMTSTREILSDIGHKHGPKKFLIAFGYCGWAPGQLENELAQHAWVIASADPKLIFDDDRKTLWQEAMTRQLHSL